jgi:hypothetical protein
MEKVFIVIDRKIRDDLLQSYIFLFEFFQALCLIDPKAAKFLFPAVIGLFGDADLATSVFDCNPPTEFDLDRS